ncbi:MAG: hypothetical protein M1838_005647, partial [Thelocarpon superellum]
TKTRCSSGQRERRSPVPLARIQTTRTRRMRSATPTGTRHRLHDPPMTLPTCITATTRPTRTSKGTPPWLMPRN